MVEELAVPTVSGENAVRFVDGVSWWVAPSEE
jgi:hypothetical protein